MPRKKYEWNLEFKRKIPPCGKQALHINNICSLDYVHDIKKVILSTSADDLQSTLQQYKENEPEPLSRQFHERKSRAEAITHQREKRSNILLFPSGKHMQTYLYSIYSITYTFIRHFHFSNFCGLRRPCNSSQGTVQ